MKIFQIVGVCLLWGMATCSPLPYPPSTNISCPNQPGTVFQPEYGDFGRIMCFGPGGYPGSPSFGYGMPYGTYGTVTTLSPGGETRFIPGGQPWVPHRRRH